MFCFLLFPLTIEVIYIVPSNMTLLKPRLQRRPFHFPVAAMLLLILVCLQRLVLEMDWLWLS